MGACSCCCTAICCIIFWAIMIPIIIAIALLLYFLIPRIPAYDTNYEGMNNYQLTPNYFMINVTYSILLKNKNWVDIKFDGPGSKLDVYHQGDYVGTPSLPTLIFPKRKDTTRYMNIILSTTNTTVIAGIIAEVPQKTFNVKGYLRAVYISTGINIDINETFQVDLTSSK